MRLVLLRHGIAQDREDPRCPPDADRRLTPEGVDKTRRALLGLRALDERPDAVLSSPYRRARETADLALAALRLKSIEVQETDALLPEAEPQALLKVLARLERAKVVLAAGHAPQVDVFVARALGAPGPVTELKKAGAVCLELSPHSARRARLVWLLEPKALRVLGARRGADDEPAPRRKASAAKLASSGSRTAAKLAASGARAAAGASQRLATSGARAAKGASQRLSASRAKTPKP